MTTLSPQSAAVLRDYLNYKGEMEGVRLTEREAWQSKEFQGILRATRYKSNKPGGAKARALAKLKREKDDDFWPGSDNMDWGE